MLFRDKGLTNRHFKELGGCVVRGKDPEIGWKVVGGLHEGWGDTRGFHTAGGQLEGA